MRNGHPQLLLRALLVVLLGVVGHPGYGQQASERFSFSVPEKCIERVTKDWGLTFSDDKDRAYLLDGKGRILGGRVQDLGPDRFLYVMEPRYTPRTGIIVKDGEAKTVSPALCYLSGKLCAALGEEEFDEKMKGMLAACEVDSDLTRPTQSCKSGVMVWDYCNLHVVGCNLIAEVGGTWPIGPIGTHGQFCVQAERCNLHCKES